MTTPTQTTRAAAFLVAAEVRNAREAARFVSAGEPFTLFPTDAWRQTRLLLAEAMEFSSWTLVAAVYDAIHGYNWRVSAGILDDAALKSRVCQAIEDAAPSAEEALAPLVQHTAD